MGLDSCRVGLSQPLGPQPRWSRYSLVPEEGDGTGQLPRQIEPAAGAATKMVALLSCSRGGRWGWTAAASD